MRDLARAKVQWKRAVRIIRTLCPLIDVFEDIADPADWPLLISAEMRTNPRLVHMTGNLDLVRPGRRVGGPGACCLMAPFAHVSPDRASRFSDGTYGVLYVAKAFETALLETVHHHARFMAATAQPPGWTSQFREIALDVDASLHDLRTLGPAHPALDPDGYAAGQALAAALRGQGSDGVAYPSVRHPGGACAGLFCPDRASQPAQGRHVDCHWDGARVDLYRDLTARRVWRVT